MTKLFSNLRTRLLLLVLLAVLPALGLIFYTNLEQRRLAAMDAQEEALRLAQLVVLEQERLIDNAHQLLIALTQLPVVRDSKRFECQALFANLVEQYPGYANLGAADLDGDVYCSSLSFSGVVNIRDRRYFQQALATNDFAIGDFQIGRITGKPGLNFGYPVHDEGGRVQGVVYIALDLAWLSQFVAQAQLPPGSVLTINDRQGTILTRYPDPEQWVGQSLPETPIIQAILAQQREGTGQVAGVDGIPRLYAFTPLKGAADAGVYVSIGFPTAVAFAEADRLLVRNLSLLGLVSLAAFIATWLGSDLFVLRQVRVLLGATARLAAGELGARTNIPYGRGELSQLARAFDHMAEVLEQRERALKTLSESNQALVRAAAESDLLTDVCQILVTTGEYHLAWVGFAEQDDKKTVRPVVQVGFEAGYLERLNITYADTEQGRGPTGTAIRTGQPVICQNILTDANYASWCDEASKHGYASSISLPLTAEGETMGALNIYASEPDAFDAGQVKLLAELADDLAYGLISLRTRAERERAEVALRESEAKFRSIVQSSPMGMHMYRLEADGRLVFTDANPAADAILGVDHSQFMGQTIEEAFPALVETEVPEKYRVAAAKGEQWQTEQINYEGDQISGAFEVHGFQTSPGKMVAMFLDITGRTRAEAALRESEERYRTLVENIPIGIYRTTPDANGTFLMANPAFLRMFGYASEAELKRVNVAKLYARPTERKTFSEDLLAQVSVTGIERQLKKKDGTLMWGLVTARVIYAQGKGRPEAAYFDCTIEDITERKRAEQEIQRRNRELEVLNAVIATSASGMEAETILETACRGLALTFDLPQATAALLNQDKTEAVVVAEYRADERLSLLNETVLIESSPSIQYLLTHQASLVADEAQSDPRLGPVHDLLRQRGIVSLLVVPLIIEREVVGALGLEATEPRHFSPEEASLVWSVVDQAAAALARIRLDRARHLLSTAIEQTGESVIITDPEGTILYVNPAFEQTTGYSRAEAIGQNPRLLKSGEHDVAFYQELWATISAGLVWQGHFINRKQDGTFYTDEATITPVRDESGTIVNYVGVQRDVTRELELEEQYHQAQKMEAVGRLTGGIAHDFNNLLTAINGFAELLQMRLPPDDPHQKLLGNILSAGQRATELIGQLLAFSRKQIIQPKVLDLNVVVANMDRMLQRIIGEDIDLQTLFSPDLWPVKADPTQIEQVIVNLAVNARDAMPEGGRLTIETANVVLDENYVADHLEAQPGEHVLLTVSDAGLGMTKEVQAHIFEPFFTTKEKGKGTGLGLATIYGIVKQSGGNIRVYSEEGQGTTFKIYLPRTGEAVFDSPGLDQVGDMPHGTETVLLVEDEPAVRKLAADLLDQQGYTVLEAGDGEEALHLIREYSGEIHLLLTDVVMPQLGGKVLADRLRAVRPDTKVLFTSAYTDNAILHHGVLDPEMAFIQKPFSAAALARKVREVLDGP